MSFFLLHRFLVPHGTPPRSRGVIFFICSAPATHTNTHFARYCRSCNHSAQNNLMPGAPCCNIHIGCVETTKDSLCCCLSCVKIGCTGVFLALWASDVVLVGLQHVCVWYRYFLFDQGKPGTISGPHLMALETCPVSSTKLLRLSRRLSAYLRTSLHWNSILMERLTWKP